MPRVLNRLRGWVEASHPFPLASVLVLTALIAVASGKSGLSVDARLGLVLLAMLFSQLAIGWTNDYVDRETDRRSRTEKPIAAGRVKASEMPLAIVAVLLAALVAGVVLGPLPLLFLIVGTAAGLSYDLWLKRSHWSWAPFVVAFSVLPLYVWSALDLARGELFAIYVVALPLVPAAHIANVLPDIDADAASGRRNLAVIWGRGLSVQVLAFFLLAPVMLTAISIPLIEYQSNVIATVVVLYSALCAAAALSYRRLRDREAFRIVVVASVLFASGWLVAV